MAATPIDLLTEYNAGEFLRKEDINALIRLARRQNVGPEGVAGNDTNSQGSNRLQPQVLHGTNGTGETIPAYSIFAVSSSAIDFNSPPRAALQKFGRQTAGSPFALYTNGLHAIPDGYKLECLPVAFSVPRLLRVDPDNIPIPGATCGPKLESFEITSEAFGLVCLSNPEYRDAGGEIVASDSLLIDAVYIWCIQSAKPVRLIGFVYGADVTAYDSATQTLGSGTIKVNFRHNIADADINKLQTADDTAGAEWTATVYNRSTSTYAVGELVTATETTGVGLLIDVAGIEQVALADFRSHLSTTPEYTYPKPSDLTYDNIFPAYIQRAVTFIDDPLNVSWNPAANVSYPVATDHDLEPVWVYSTRGTYIPPTPVGVSNILLKPIYKINGKWHCYYYDKFKLSAYIDVSADTLSTFYGNFDYDQAAGHIWDGCDEDHCIVEIGADGIITAHREFRGKITVSAIIAYVEHYSPVISMYGHIYTASAGGTGPPATWGSTGQLPFYFHPYTASGGSAETMGGSARVHLSETFNVAFDAGNKLKFKVAVSEGKIYTSALQITIQPTADTW